MTATLGAAEPSSGSSGAVAFAHACRADALSRRELATLARLEGAPAALRVTQRRSTQSLARQSQYTGEEQSPGGRARAVPAERDGRDGRTGGSAGGGMLSAPLFSRTAPPRCGCPDANSATAAAIQAPQMPNTTARSVTHCARDQAAAGACRRSTAAVRPPGSAGLSPSPPDGCCCPSGAASANGAPTAAREVALRPIARLRA